MHVMFGLLSLKYVSDAFDERHAELVAEEFEEDIDAYRMRPTSGRRFGFRS